MCGFLTLRIVCENWFSVIDPWCKTDFECKYIFLKYLNKFYTLKIKYLKIPLSCQKKKIKYLNDTFFKLVEKFNFQFVISHYKAFYFYVFCFVDEKFSCAISTLCLFIYLLILMLFFIKDWCGFNCSSHHSLFLYLLERYLNKLLVFLSNFIP